ncbi:hypothetical protein AB986_13840 [Alkalihalobacillus macyae]|uniref:Uncharacterized protein n=1 Tax=Guptibacillus hwajinpoensis TaxID=208199 RepID=A0A0J6CY61_9BACL|nr:hypothetical protein AB986_13840 [Alkalihalobacillus macyae]
MFLQKIVQNQQSFRKALFVGVVSIRMINFRSKMLAFRRAGGETPRRYCGVSPVPLVPQESSILPLQLAKFGLLFNNCFEVTIF